MIKLHSYSVIFKKTNIFLYLTKCIFGSISCLFLFFFKLCNFNNKCAIDLYTFYLIFFFIFYEWICKFLQFALCINHFVKNSKCFSTYFIADGTLKLWDLRHPEEPNGTYPHGSEVLCCDWAKTDEVIFKFFF